jgi:hypothetical protein
MKLRTGLSLLLAAALIGGLVAPSSLAAKKKKKKSGPVVVGTDAADDWGANVDPTIAPAGEVLAQELVEASIVMADADTVNFVIKLKGLPPSGGIPEVTRYGWDFTVDGEALAMSGGFTDYIRGVCYPVHSGAGSCPPPKDPGMGAFFIRRGPCTVGAGGLGECELLANVNATFDTASSTITVPVPLEALGAKPGSKIAPGANATFGAAIYASPAAVIASPNAPHDTMMVTGTFVVPKGK